MAERPGWTWKLHPFTAHTQCFISLEHLSCSGYKRTVNRKAKEPCRQKANELSWEQRFVIFYRVIISLVIVAAVCLFKCASNASDIGGAGRCFGAENSEGQCDPPARLTNAVAIAGGNLSSVALKSDGTASVWGYNYRNLRSVPAGFDQRSGYRGWRLSYCGA